MFEHFSYFLNNLKTILRWPLLEGGLVYWPFLIGSVLIGVIVFRKTRKGKNFSLVGFLKYFFNKKIFLHRSTFVDCQLALLNTVITPAKLILRLILGGAVIVSVANWVEGGYVKALGPMESGLSLGVGTILGYTLVVALLFDFTEFFAHYLFHRIPILWQFHQVHHSARVLTPVTFFREHPVDVLIRSSFLIVVIGFLQGSENYLFLEPVQVLTLFGANIFIVTYSFTSRILIHSHIPFRFPPLLANIFTSPSYHQVHHSTDPRLHHKNIAAGFTFWDRLFQTQYMPTPDQKLIFGLSRGVQEEHGNLFEALFKPFGEAFKVVVGKR